MLLRYCLLLFLTGFVRPLPAQPRSAYSTLTGRVLDQKGHALPGANGMLKGTYDGTTVDSTGAFRVRTTQTDSVTVLVSYIGYEPL